MVWDTVAIFRMERCFVRTRVDQEFHLSRRNLQSGQNHQSCNARSSTYIEPPLDHRSSDSGLVFM